MHRCFQKDSRLRNLAFDFYTDRKILKNIRTTLKIVHTINYITSIFLTLLFEIIEDNISLISEKPYKINKLHI